MTRDELDRHQWTLLTGGLARVLETNRFYQRKFEAAGVELAAIRGRDNLANIPFTTKEELLADQEAHPPYGTNLTEPIECYTRLHQTSGTSGRRLRWLDTPVTWAWILDCWDLIYQAVGLRDADRLFFPFSFGPFLGFWAAFGGACRRGLFVLAGGGMSTRARLDLIFDNQISVVLCTPTYALRMAEVAQTDGVDLTRGPVRKLILAGEPGANIDGTRRRIEAAWAARVHDHSGMTEIGSLGIEFDALPGKLFLLENHAICEFVEPATAKPVAEGELGELVITNLGRWSSPLLRYRTGDLVRCRANAAPDGFPFVYLEGGILARTDDMLWIKGNNIYPSAVESVLRSFDELAEFSIAYIEAERSLEITIEPAPGTSVAELAGRVTRAVADRLYFRPTVKTTEPGTLPRFEMKAERFRRVYSVREH